MQKETVTTGKGFVPEKKQGAENCINSCLECYRVCTETLPYCLGKGGRHVEPEHITLLLNCGRICQVSAEFMLTNSLFQTQTCGTCAEVCEQCATNCDRMRDDSQMKRCAESCRSCAESCKQMMAH